MRIHRVLASVLFLALATSSCSLDNAVAPAGRELAGAGDSQTLLIGGPLGPRLPPPGREATSGSPEDRALFDRLISPAGKPRPSAASHPVVFWNRLTRELGLGAKLSPPMLGRGF